MFASCMTRVKPPTLETRDTSFGSPTMEKRTASPTRRSRPNWHRAGHYPPSNYKIADDQDACRARFRCGTPAVASEAPPLNGALVRTLAVGDGWGRLGTCECSCGRSRGVIRGFCGGCWGHPLRNTDCVLRRANLRTVHIGINLRELSAWKKNARREEDPQQHNH